MSLQSTKEIERLVNDYLNVSSGDDWVVFHFTLVINEQRADYVSGEVVYHAYRLSDARCYPHTNINKFVLGARADFDFIPAALQVGRDAAAGQFTVRAGASHNIAVEDDRLTDWEFACLLNQISKEECGQLLFDAFGAKENIDYLSYPTRLRVFLDEAFDSYLQFEAILGRAMQKHAPPPVIL